jgi:CMP-N-acetylneuraminic acid synthetase
MFVLSTDDERIVQDDSNFKEFLKVFRDLNPGESCQVSSRKVIHRRVGEHASNSSKTIESLMQFVETQAFSNTDIAVLLQPTAPFRTVRELREIIQSLDSHGYQSLGSATIFDSPHPSKSFLMSKKDSKIDKTFLKNLATPRQELPTYLVFDGAYYLNSIQNLRENLSIVNKRTHIFMRNGAPTINIDNMNDLNYARYLAQQMNMLEKLSSD